MIAQFEDMVGPCILKEYIVLSEYISVSKTNVTTPVTLLEILNYTMHTMQIC